MGTCVGDQRAERIEWRAVDRTIGAVVLLAQHGGAYARVDDAAAIASVDGCHLANQ